MSSRVAIRAAAASLRERPEENKVLIVLSDGRPNDIIVNRPNSRNPAPYAGDYAVRDTASEVRKVRAEGISVLGVFAGEEEDLWWVCICGGSWMIRRKEKAGEHAVQKYIRQEKEA